MKNITTVILAAGRSARFISSKSKLTHELAGYPIINHVFDNQLNFLLQQIHAHYMTFARF